MNRSCLLLQLIIFISALLPTSSQITIEPEQCPIPRPHLSATPLTPTWQASFPGSGSRMTWSLIQALTGLQTGDDFNSHGFGFDNVVTVKTHYPVKTARNTFESIDVKFGRAIVILRNPMHAIPSYFNLLYERKYHLPNHSTRGSNEEWVEYRDHANHGLQYQLEMFEQFVSYWLMRFRGARDNMLLVSYEDMIGERGADGTRRIADFLTKNNNEGVSVDNQQIACIWRKVVKFKDAQQQEQQRMLIPAREMKANPHSLREGPRERPYKRQQLEDILGVLNRLVDGISYDEEFVRIMRGYMDSIHNTVPVE